MYNFLLMHAFYREVSEPYGEMTATACPETAATACPEATPTAGTVTVGRAANGSKCAPAVNKVGGPFTRPDLLAVCAD